MDLIQNSQVSLENLVFMAVGFCLGLLVSLVLIRAGSRVFSGRFRDMSSQALYDNSSKFMEMAQSYFSGYAREARNEISIRGNEIKQAVDPVRQIMDKYESRLNIMERERENAYGAISARLVEMARSQQQLTVETGNLAKALRVPHVRGRWGEVTLKRAAELSGMAAHCDFEEQVGAGMGTGRGKGTLRPDMVVTLPGNRKIVVDAKVPLIAYLDGLEAGDEKERSARMKDHARQVSSHISLLGKKGYWAHFTPSPEFTVLFIPGENFFSAALVHQPDLIEKGIEKGVILATPTTLIALLKAVAYSWQQQKGYENAEKIRDLGAELHGRLSSMAGHMNRLGRDIEKTVSTYNRTVGTMERRVMASARKLDSLSVSSTKLEGLEDVCRENGIARQIEGNQKVNGDNKYEV